MKIVIDGLYLALAEREGCPLVTDDQKLIKAATGPSPRAMSRCRFDASPRCTARLIESVEARQKAIPASFSSNDTDVPTILRERGYRFFFYMADRFEPPHVHVTRDDSAAKLWLDPLEFAFVEGFRRHECNDILRITEAHLDEFLRAWYQTFGGLQP